MTQDIKQKSLILVVDDDKTLLKMAAVTLGKRGHEVVTAASGEEGFAFARTRIPDVIVLDVMLPDISGWTFIKRIRSTAELLLVPVIFLTALDNPKDRVHGFSLGADDYLTKPFHLEELTFRIQKSLNRRIELAPASMAQIQKTEPDRKSAFQGSLGDLGLSSVLLLLELEKRSGTLRINQSQGDGFAEILVRDGAVVSVLREHRSIGMETRNTEAFYHLMRWSDGHFNFLSGEIDVADEIKTSTSHLLMEAARRIDESERDAEG